MFHPRKHIQEWFKKASSKIKLKLAIMLRSNGKSNKVSINEVIFQIQNQQVVNIMKIINVFVPF
jgi:hypothetical protein